MVIVELNESKAEKKTEQTWPEDRMPEGRPAWYETWRGTLIAIFLILLFFLVNRVNVANCVVALLSVAATYLFLRVHQVRSRVVKVVFGLVWFLLLPNTAYLFTDLGHILYQWNNAVSLFRHVLLVAQYCLLEIFGVATFLFSFYPFEKIVDQVKLFKDRKAAWLVLFNLLVGFGVVLGRYEHINSNVVFTEPLKVLGSMLDIFTSLDLLGLAVLFGLLCNLVYFLFRRLFLQRRSRRQFAQ